MVIIQRITHCYSRIIILTRCVIYIRNKGVTKVEGVYHLEHMVREEPWVTPDGRVLSRMYLIKRSEHTILEPAGISFRICESLMSVEHVTTKVMPPVTIVAVR